MFDVSIVKESVLKLLKAYLYRTIFAVNLKMLRFMVINYDCTILYATSDNSEYCPPNSNTSSLLPTGGPVSVERSPTIESYFIIQQTI